MSRAPTLEDVARQAGVSRATASRVVNADPRVGADAREAVQAAIAALGYSPNLAARTLVTRRTESIAVVVPESDAMVFTDPFFAGTLHGVNLALSGTRLQMVLVMGQPGEGVDGRMEQYLRGGHTDGAIVVSHHQGDQLWRVLEDTQLPCVFLGRPYSPDAAVPFVDVDNVAGAELATRHLIERGCTRIGTVTGSQDMSAGQDRLAGWRRALAAAGLPDTAVAAADFTRDGGQAATRRLFADHPDLDGLFVASDQMAEEALQVLAAAGRRVPEDVAVVGFDDLELARRTQPPLTTVVNPISAMAERAVAMLLDLLAGQPVETPYILDPRLVVRGTA
ncbi:LacI family DNA-binding transcriptional regulator [Nocardioides limicola]|uniref:LacI family DNA-binding transcriptional regulator n=1 Tax=Nocardioides limicola TaxID=2803368 RepID=UPI00193B5DEB|nr:LacI family DNA-binding transcriptional regulator [Nocardioides sp. DJM-14]